MVVGILPLWESDLQAMQLFALLCWEYFCYVRFLEAAAIKVSKVAKRYTDTIDFGLESSLSRRHEITSVSRNYPRDTSFSSKHVCFKASHMYPSIEKSSHSDNDGMLVCLGNVVTFFLICAADETPVWILSSAFDIWHTAVLRFFFSLCFWSQHWGKHNQPQLKSLGTPSSAVQSLHHASS